MPDEPSEAATDLTCPHCSCTLVIKAQLSAGQRVRCANCKDIFTFEPVPAADEYCELADEEAHEPAAPEWEPTAALQPDADINPPRHVNRYDGWGRCLAGALVGVVAGMLCSASLATGVGLAIASGAQDEWTILQWGDHWIWRGLGSGAATLAAGFLAGLASRRRGGIVAVVAVLPATSIWAIYAWSGWTGRVLGGDEEFYLPLGYRIVATILALGSAPLAWLAGREGAAYGRANAYHFDSRRAAIFGVRWYQFLWIPIMLHMMVLAVSWAGVYGIHAFVTNLRAGFSVSSAIPFAFCIGMFITLGWLTTGAFRSYEALAGFREDSDGPVWQQVLKYGVGRTMLTILILVVVLMSFAWLSRFRG